MPVMIAVYYVGQAIMFNSWIAPMASIPGDIIQNIVGLVIAIPVCVVLKKHHTSKEFLMEVRHLAVLHSTDGVFMVCYAETMNFKIKRN